MPQPPETPRHEIAEVLGFWLDEVGPKGWYRSDAALDEACRDRFGEASMAARNGRLGPWEVCAEGALALLLLLDQFPRNIHRGSAMAFAADPRARAVAKTAIARGFDMATAEPARQFFYLPLMHSETLQDQERSVRLIMTRMPETGSNNIEHALKHRDVIRRFGRFPSRNAALGRQDSLAENSYRAGGGYMG